MANAQGRTGVRIVVAGDKGTGKSSLIISASCGSFPENVPPVLPPTKLPEDMCPDRVPITIIDTSSRYEDSVKIVEELRRADTVVLTYARDQSETLESLTTFWLPHLRELEVKVPVIVAGCKFVLRDRNQHVSLKTIMSPIMEQFPEIEGSINCSASRLIQEVTDSKASICAGFEANFILCDHDRDGALNDNELNNFQVKCFDAPLQPSEVKMVVQERISEGVNEHGLTLKGFVFLHHPLRKQVGLETTWIVLRKFGYNDDLKLAFDLIPPLKRAPDQSVELTNTAVDFLKAIFDAHDGDGDGMLRPRELEKLFSTAPDRCSPWTISPYKDAVEKNAFGGLSRDAFLSEWAIVTLLNPTFSVENLMYIGYPGDPSSAIHVTRKRRLDHKKQLSERNVLQCFVFGPSKAGKSTLLNSFIGRPYSDTYNPTIEDRYAVNVIDISVEKKKYLVLREIPGGGARELLADKESLASCDIALFVYDRSDELSWRASSELLVEIAGHGEDTGFEVPCLIIAAKDDIDSFPMALEETVMVSQDMGVEAPIPISVRMGYFNSLFHRIVTAAEFPHLSIPETEVGRSRRRYHRLLNRSAVLVGAAVVVVGMAMNGSRSISP